MTEPPRHSWEELVERTRREWGDRLVPVAAAFVAPVVHERTREFLTTVGLPDVKVRDIEPVRDERLLDLFERDGRRYVVVVATQRPFGGGPVAYRYGVDVETGWVHYLHDEPDYETPANSSIAAFVLALGLLKNQLADLVVGTEEAVNQAVGTIWDQLDEWDPDGMVDDSYRWNVLLNEYGMEYD